MIFIPEKIVWFFTDDAQTIEEASLYLRIVGLSQIPLAYNFVLSGALRGAGDTKTNIEGQPYFLMVCSNYSCFCVKLVF